MSDDPMESGIPGVELSFTGAPGRSNPHSYIRFQTLKNAWARPEIIYLKRRQEGKRKAAQGAKK